jgi:type I restriction enzyme S subunit
LLGTILRQVAVAGITGSDLIKLEIPLPPLPEQRAIAGVLGALDDKIELSRRMNRTLESMARAVFRQWFVESEEVGNWEEKTLEDVTVKITKGTTPTTLGQRFTESGINFVKVNSITDDHKFIPESFDFIDEETHALLSRSIIEKDDVLLTIAGTIGRIAKVPDYILPANTNQAVAIIRPDKSQVLPNYIRMWLCLDDVRQELFANVVHAVQANLSLGMISKTKIRLPEYSRLVKLFEPIELLLQKIEANTKESRTLASLRDSLLPKLMKGEVRVKVSEL